MARAELMSAQRALACSQDFSTVTKAALVGRLPSQAWCGGKAPIAASGNLPCIRMRT